MKSAYFTQYQAANNRTYSLQAIDTVLYYTADVLSATDYYPFGSPMPGRSLEGESYRFGFNGMEKDDEVKGKGNHISFADYGYDPGIGRRWNIDPKAKKYPYFSAYMAFGNNPNIYIDSDGKEIYLIINSKDGEEPIIQKANLEDIILWVGASQMGKEFINRFINNSNEDLYISFGNIGQGSYAKTYRSWDENGNLTNPKIVEIEDKSTIGKNYDSDGYEAMTEFEGVEIDVSKKNYFVLLDVNTFGKTKNDKLLDQKKGAKVLGHEMGAHLKDQKTSGKYEHDEWGQKEYGTFEADKGSKASIFNKQVDKAIDKSSEYTIKNVVPGKWKLVNKDE